MPQIYFLLFVWPLVIGYRIGDTHYTDYTNHHHRAHHVRHHHRDDASHGSLDDILRRLDGHHHKKDDVLSIDEASKQLQKAMDNYKKSIDAVKRRESSWDDDDDDDEKIDDWSMDTTESTISKDAEDKTGGVDDAFENYDSNVVERDDEDDEDVERMQKDHDHVSRGSQVAADAPASAPHLQNSADEQSFSTRKWELMGTSAAVDATRQNADLTRRAKGSASDHIIVANTYRVLTSCRHPMPIIVKISKVYPKKINKQYFPDCVTLHWCSQLSGCCDNSNYTCGPANVTIVTLPLKAMTAQWEYSKYNSGYHKDYLQFRNHTSCRCQKTQNRTALDTIDFSIFAVEPTTPQRSAATNQRAAEDRQLLSSANQRQTRNIALQDSALSSRTIHTTEVAKREETCKCPSRYTARLLANGDCICDCFDKQSDCLRNKRGKDYFIKPDQECVRKGQCKVPSCDYGEYMKYVGKCPGKIENFHDTWNRSKKPTDLYFSRSWRSYGS